MKVKVVHTLEEIEDAIKDNIETAVDVHSHSNIGDEGPSGARALGEAFAKSQFLSELHLHNNKLGYEGVQYLCSALAQPTAPGGGRPGNRTLEVLILRSNGVSAHCGQCALCRSSPEFPAALEELTALRVIDLHGNELQTIPFSIAEMPKLISLDIRNNPVQNIPTDVLVTARQSHQAGWPILKEYMLKQLAETAAL